MYEMKESGVEWVGKIPAHWEVKKLKYNFSYNKTIVGIYADNYERLALTMNGVVKRSKDDTNGLQPINFETYQILKKGEFVFKLMDLQNISTSRVGLSNYDGLVSPAYIILKKTGNILSEYAEKYFLYMWENKVFNALGNDGVRSSLNAIDLLELPIIIPPLEEQEKISDYLDKKCAEVDKIIEIKKQQIELLKEYRKNLISETVLKGLNKDVEMKESGVEWVGKIPEHWKTIRIKYLLNERKERSENGTEEPLSMSQKYGVIPTKEREIISNLASTYIDAKIVYSGDLVVNKLRAHMGILSVSKYNGLVSPDYSVYYSTGKADLKYLEYLFKTPQCISEFKKKSKGVAEGFTRLYTDDLFSIYCPLPPVEEQEKISSFLDKKCKEIDKIISLKNQQTELLKEYKKSLIYEYVTGKKEVK